MTTMVKRGVAIGYIVTEELPEYAGETPSPLEREHRQYVTVYYPDGSHETIRADCPTGRDRAIVSGAEQQWQEFFWDGGKVSVSV